MMDNRSRHLAPLALKTLIPHGARSRQIELTRVADSLAEGGDVVTLSPGGGRRAISLPNTGGFWLSVPFDDELVRVRKRFSNSLVYTSLEYKSPA